MKANIQVLVTLSSVDGKAITDDDIRQSIDGARRHAHFLLEVGEVQALRNAQDAKTVALKFDVPAAKAEEPRVVPVTVMPNLAGGERFRKP